MQPQRLVRIVQLLELLNSRRAFTAGTLAEIFACTRRTIFRDLALVREAGIEVLFDPARSAYSLPASSPRTGARMTSAELTSLLLAVATSPLRYEKNIARDLEAGITKLLCQLRDQDRQSLLQVWEAVDNEPDERESSQISILIRILNALLRQEEIQVELARNAPKASQYLTVSPRRIVSFQSQWYVTAFSSSLHRWVKFGVQEIVSLRDLPHIHVREPGWCQAFSVPNSGV